jgi:uncharacterized repeat protein (TIGR01451 family)
MQSKTGQLSRLHKLASHGVAALVLTAAVHGTGREARAQQPLPPEAQRFVDKVGLAGTVSIIVTFRSPVYSREQMGQAQLDAALQSSVSAGQRALLTRLAPYSVTNVKEFPYVPQMALTVSSIEALQALYADPSVITVHEDTAVPPALFQSVSKIRATEAHALLFKGQGQSIAILDTGVDKSHQKLAGKVVSEACYSTNNSAQQSSSLCPGGVPSSIAVGSGVNCPAGVTQCDHGTHVAGIASAIAPSATLIAIQVFSRYTDSATSTPCADANRTSPCTRSNVSDLIAAMNRVYALRTTYNIAAVNMSLGGGEFAATCDTDPRKTSIDLLRAAGIAAVIAAGNKDYTNAMSAPACISTAISVAATNDFDKVASFSNLSGITTVFAPGDNIYSAVPGTATQPKSGTSMSAPHVAGAIAVLKQINPAMSVNALVSLLATNGPLVTDQRTGGFISKRRLDVYEAMCDLISCDSDDFRSLALNATLTGSIAAAADRDLYTFNGIAGNKLTLSLNRTSGGVDPYLELTDPDGIRIALNDNGGGVPNALISGLTLAKTGKYVITASTKNGSSGNYSLAASQQAVALNPVPRIDLLQPSSATGMSNASDFWIKVYGQNFSSNTRFAWNADTLTWFPADSNSAWVRVPGSALAHPWPRTAYLYAYTPAPGGGYSNIASFSVTNPALGTSELVSPTANSAATVGVKTTLAISWTHPTDSWRTMQNMDLRLRDQDGRVAAWVRVVERTGNTSVYRLLNSASGVVDSSNLGPPIEGLPGENRNLTISDTVTLHLADSMFAGAGRTATMTPTITFGPNAVGVYNVEFRVDGPNGEVQDDDVLGVLTVTPSSCPVAVTGAALSGPTTGIANTDYTYTVAFTPSNATQPISVTWSPEPQSGQGTATASYNWPIAGEQIVFVSAENCGNFVADLRTIALRTSSTPDLSIHKHAARAALAGQPITYTLFVTNSGGETASGLVVLDSLPAGATYLSGGSLQGNLVRFDIPALPGFGGSAVVSYAVTAAQDINNSVYSVSAGGGYTSDGVQAVATRIVDALADLGPLTDGALGEAPGASLTLPAGALANAALVALDNSPGPLPALPQGTALTGGHFQLDVLESNQPAVLILGEAVTVTVAVTSATPAPKLFYWSNNSWRSTGVMCSVPAAGRMTCAIAAAPSGTHFAVLTGMREFKTHLPVVQRDSGGRTARINAIGISGSSYTVAFSTSGFTPDPNGMHVHFFFNTLPPEQAGTPGGGPWWMYGGPSPYPGVPINARPVAATHLCVLAANGDHSILPGTGNCHPLPESSSAGS